jgi:cardiolipin synthase
LRALEKDLTQASESISLQVMSFEADQAGHQVVDLLNHHPHLQRRLLIDAYSTVVVNDTWLAKPFGSTRWKTAREEARQLWPLLQQAMSNGIDIRFTQPLGPLFLKYPFRNHKKCVLIDHKVSYVGGINITDHNFGWNDLMIRQQVEPLASALQDSFEADWQAGFLPKPLPTDLPKQLTKQSQSSDLTTTKTQPTTNPSNRENPPPAYQQIDPSTELYLLNGLSTKTAYRQLQQTVEQAKRVQVFSPYISYPMLDSVAKVPDHTVWMPEHNNKPLINLLSHLPRYRSLNIQKIPGSPEEMLHAKVMVLDEETVLYGSSNFDVVSYLFEKEMVIVRRDKELANRILGAIQP